MPITAVLLVSVAGYFFIHSSFFNIKSIKVSGTRNFPAAEIIKLSGLQQGVNIFQIDLAAAEKKIMTQVLVETAEIEKRFPAAILIKIEERIPFIQVPISGGILQIDAHGYILAKQKIISGQKLPMITGVSLAPTVSIGTKLDSRQLLTGLSIAAQMDQGMKDIVGEINVADPQKIRLYTIQGAEVRLGSSSDLKTKFNRFLLVLKEAEKLKKLENIQYIDVSFIDKPVIFYRP